MFSVEIGATRLIEKEKSFWIIVGLMYASHAANILIDLFVVRTLLLSRRIRQLVHILSVLGKEFLSFLKMYLKICMQLFKKVFVQKGKDTEPHNEVVPLARRKRNIIVRFWNHLDDVRKDPTKAGLWTVYALCVPPRMPVGGVSLAVFLVQYNKMGLRGWLAIFVGVTTHVAWALPSAYGVLSFF